MNNDGMIGSKYEHYKGNKYVVLDIAKHSETLEELVIYRDLSDESKVWARPKGMFCDYIERDGKRIKRFTRL